MNTLRFCLSMLVLLAVSAIGSANASAQEAVPGIKADSIAVLGYYFKWPADAIAGDNFVIGVLGQAPFTAERITQRVQAVNGKPIVVREFASAKDYAPCHLLFVGDQPNADSDEKTAKARLDAVLPKIKGSAMLLVTETPGFAQQGAVVNFVVDLVANRVVMEVNLDEAKRRNLGLTRGLLQLERSNKVTFLADPDEEAAN